MSMHEFESLVEDSVRVLDNCKKSNKLNTRSFFYTLYQFQDMFDTGMTYFRVMDILLKHKFFYNIDRKDLPNYSEHKEYYDSLNGDGIESIYKTPKLEWQASINPVIAYWRKDKVFVPAYSTILPELTIKGVLPAEESASPEKADLFEVANIVAQEAEVQNEIELIAYWYLLLPHYVCMQSENLESLPDNEHLSALREIAQRTGADSMDLSYGALKKPSLEDLAGEDSDLMDLDEFGESLQFLKWWYRL